MLTNVAVTDADREAALLAIGSDTPIRDVSEAIARARAEGEKAEAERWGARLDFFHEEFGADGSGCDSGDALDVIESEARQVIVRLTDERDEARAEEREACAKVCDEWASKSAQLQQKYQETWDEAREAEAETMRESGEELAAAIRARGEKGKD